MSFVRSVPLKNSGTSTTIHSLPTLPKLPSRLQPKRPIVVPDSSKIEMKVPLSTIPNQDELDDIVNNISTIVKRSEQSLTPVKSSHVTTTIRRTSSLHITNRRNLSNSIVKTSSSHHETLTESNLDISRSSECISNVHRRSFRKAERFSGIKCSLPSGISTIPHTFKGLEKHCTPTKTRQSNISSSFIENQITPTATHGKVKSPWRLRFEKFLNHQDLTPLSPRNESIAFTTTKTSSSNKENRTPSFRPPARKSSKISLLSKKDN